MTDSSNNSTFASVQYGPGGEVVDNNPSNANERPTNSGLVSDRFEVESKSSVSRVTYGPNGMVVQDDDRAKVSSMDRPNVAPSYSVVSTGRHGPTGRPLAPAELTPDSVVNVGGIETSAKVAMSMGLIRPAPGGGFEDASPQPQPQPSTPQPSALQNQTQTQNQTHVASDASKLANDAIGPYAASEPLPDEDAADRKSVV